MAGIIVQDMLYCIRIDAVERDPMDKHSNAGVGKALWLHTPSVQMPDGMTHTAELEAQAPKLKSRTGAVCTEALAREHGALMFNRSKP